MYNNMNRKYVTQCTHIYITNILCMPPHTFISNIYIVQVLCEMSKEIRPIKEKGKYSLYLLYILLQLILSQMVIIL